MAAWIPIALAVGSTFLGMKANKANANAQIRKFAAEDAAASRNAIMRELEGERIKEEAKVRASRIREAAIKMRGAQNAAMAANGIMVGFGSAQTAVDETTHLAERDVLVMLENAAQGAIIEMEDARTLRASGQQSLGQISGVKSALKLNQMSTLLSGAQKAYGFAQKR